MKINYRVDYGGTLTLPESCDTSEAVKSPPVEWLSRTHLWGEKVFRLLYAFYEAAAYKRWRKQSFKIVCSPLPYWLKRIRKGWGGRAVCWIFPALLLIDDQRSLFPPKISSFLWIFLEGGWQWGGQLPVCISSVVYRLCSKTFFSKKTLKYCIEFRVSLIDEYLTTSIYSSITTR